MEGDDTEGADRADRELKFRQSAVIAMNTSNDFVRVFEFVSLPLTVATYRESLP
jgi:hypothetical protein